MKRFSDIESAIIEARRRRTGRRQDQYLHQDVDEIIVSELYYYKGGGISSKRPMMTIKCDNEIKLIDGCLPDFEGKPVLANCANCSYCSDESDGPGYGGPWYVCTKEGRDHVSNLKSFPFKTPQSCCDLHAAFLVDWEKVMKDQGEF